jgi:hypothetical protein
MSKQNYPGFIDGLKASNISINKASLSEYSEQILNILKSIRSTENLSVFLDESLKRAEHLIKNTLKEIIIPDELIVSYIKFGDIFKSISFELKKVCKLNDLRIVATNYLNIAKYTKDSRIKNLAIEIVKIMDTSL